MVAWARAAVLCAAAQSAGIATASWQVWIVFVNQPPLCPGLCALKRSTCCTDRYKGLYSPTTLATYRHIAATAQQLGRCPVRSCNVPRSCSGQMVKLRGSDRCCGCRGRLASSCRPPGCPQQQPGAPWLWCTARPAWGSGCMWWPRSMMAAACRSWPQPTSRCKFQVRPLAVVACQVHGCVQTVLVQARALHCAGGHTACNGWGQ
jgi:hypothetical protein